MHGPDIQQPMLQQLSDGTRDPFHWDDASRFFVSDGSKYVFFHIFGEDEHP
jgi:hypothetical protein